MQISIRHFLLIIQIHAVQHAYLFASFILFQECLQFGTSQPMNEELNHLDKFIGSVKIFWNQRWVTPCNVVNFSKDLIEYFHNNLLINSLNLMTKYCHQIFDPRSSSVESYRTGESKGVLGTSAVSRSKFSHFHTVLAKILPNSRFLPQTQGLVPPVLEIRDLQCANHCVMEPSVLASNSEQAK